MWGRGRLVEHVGHGVADGWGLLRRRLLLLHLPWAMSVYIYIYIYMYICICICI